MTRSELRPQIRTEAVAGVTTFFTMAYIVIVNPAILSTSGTGMEFSGVLTATVLLSFVMTLLMGLYARIPFAVAPGMGINAFFTFSVILGSHVPWTQALGMVFWAGAIFVVVSVTPLRVRIAQAIPAGLRTAAAAGIGIFLTFIGLRNAGFVVADPVTFVKLGALDLKSLASIGGMILMIFLLGRRSPAAFLSGIFAVTGIALAAGWIHAPERWVAWPDFHSVLLKLDPWGALRLAALPTILSILFTDLFDSISTFVGVAHGAVDPAGRKILLQKDGQPKGLREGLIVDAFATLGAALAGTSSGTAFIESSAGIEVGGRTGMTSVFTALCFLPCFFLAPLAAMVPAYATAPVLIVVGALMFRSVSELKMRELEDVVPAFLTIVMIPLTFSITQGILWGFVSHAALYSLAGRRREVDPWMWGLAALSVALLWLEHGRA